MGNHKIVLVMIPNTNIVNFIVYFLFFKYWNDMKDWSIEVWLPPIRNLGLAPFPGYKRVAIDQSNTGVHPLFLILFYCMVKILFSIQRELSTSNLLSHSFNLRGNLRELRKTTAGRSHPCLLAASGEMVLPTLYFISSTPYCSPPSFPRNRT